MNFLHLAINPALDLLGPKYRSNEARLLLLAIGYQESGWEDRVQVKGPARSFLQFELGGGVLGVMRHNASKDMMRFVCAALRYPFDSQALHDAMADNDVLAAAMGRLLLWTDPRPLPAIGDTGAAWQTYFRNWRPGKPHPERWPENYRKALRDLRDD